MSPGRHRPAGHRRRVALCGELLDIDAALGQCPREVAYDSGPVAEAAADEQPLRSDPPEPGPDDHGDTLFLDRMDGSLDNWDIVIGTPEMVALECIRCGNCESGRGCPRGIATTDTELAHMYGYDWGAQRIINLYRSWRIQLRDILSRFGLKSVRELVGRSDLLVHQDYPKKSLVENEAA